ncbi:MAG TPA: hypothetical protein VM690_09145, partial [Gaiellaceae bacterium]|nr:hypothetical protein [Gaiellaceae bacterium]
YAINAFGASAVVLVGPIGSQNGVPCYDPYFTTQNFGSPMPVRQPATLDRDNLNRAYVAGLSGTSGGIANLERRSLVPTPAGGDLVLALRNAADDPTRTGLAYGSVHVRRQDPDRTSVLQIPAEGPIVPRGSIALLQHGDTITDATFEATPPDGTIAVGFDGSAWRLYVRIQGHWKTAPLGGAQWGSGSVTWPGGSSTSALATVTHGLGATPSAILVTFGAATVNAVIGQWFRPTAESFSVQGVAALTQPSRGTTEAFSWYAAIA